MRFQTEAAVGNYILCIRPGGYCTFNKEMPSNGMHYHNCYELCFVTQGKGIYTHRNKTYQLDQGCVFIANPKIRHEIRIADLRDVNIEEDFKLFYFTITVNSCGVTKGNSFDEIVLDSFLGGHKVISTPQNHIFLYLSFMKQYSSNSSTNTYGMYQAIRSMVMECFVALLNDNKLPLLNNQNTVPNTALDEAIKYIGQNLSKRIELDEISRHVNVSKRTLQYIFKRNLNCTVTDYIQSRKMNIAGTYLKMNFRINEVGKLIGVEDPSQFSRLFKKYFGISPKRYQLNYTNTGMVFEASFLE